MLEIRHAKESDIDKIVEMAIEFEKYLIGVDNTLMSEIPPAAVYRKYLLAAMKERTHYTFLSFSAGRMSEYPKASGYILLASSAIMAVFGVWFVVSSVGLMY